MADPLANSSRRLWPDWTAALFLFSATAAVVVWQNSRLGVLWDLSYVLDSSYRISLGDLPYRDFPFPHAPLTFLVQAALIKLAGRVFWHTTMYCALTGGLATVMTWRILLNVLRDRLTHARLVAFLLSLPLAVLGIYCIFPHPFYDPDCTLAILISVLLLQQLDRNPASWRALLAGASLVIPLFVKQNTGLAFFASAGLALAALMTIEIFRRRPARRYICALTGAIAGLSLALLLIYFTAGLKNYWRWTIEFAAARRTPARGEMLAIYQGKILLLWLAIFAAGAILLWFSRRRGQRALALVSALLMSAPFVWPAIYLLRDQDASERADRLIAVWPVLLIAAFVIAVASIILSIRRRTGIAFALPFILIAAVNGNFMSQQLWGSTYAVWPLFMILFASTLVGLSSLGLDAGLVPQSIGRTSPPSKRSEDPQSWTTIPLAAIAAASLLVSGACYVRAHERLDYANLSDGEPARSTLPQLKGLSVRGDWIPNFEELVRYSEANIPRDDGLLLLPGEDLFYYTTGRRPRFPVLLFDHTTNPYSPEEIARLCRDKNIRWVIVKQDLQLEEDPVENRDRLIELLEKDFEQVESLNNYDIYRRSDPEKDQDDEP